MTLPASDLTDRDILLVSTADWDNPYWTNKQHVAVELGKRGHRVLYIESQGLRRPTATRRDLSRIWGRLKKGLRPPRHVRDNIWVLAPILIPLQSKSWVRRFNRWLLGATIRFWSTILGLKPRLLWTYSPLTPALYDLEGWDLVVYHAVDDIKSQPGMPRDAIESSEAILSRRADVIFTTAPHLYDVHKAQNPETHYFPNVADFAHFNTALDAGTTIPEDVAGLPAPRIGFIGAVSGYKMNFALLRAVADARPSWSFLLIGEVGEGDPWTDISTLSGATNIHLLGGRPYASLPRYLKGMDVAILPSNINDYTRSMFPMKFFEYLAAGRPVVATSLPALAEYHHAAQFVDTPEAFVTAIERCLAGAAPDLETRLTAARDQTYEIRTAKMMAIVARCLGAR